MLRKTSKILICILAAAATLTVVKALQYFKADPENAYRPFYMNGYNFRAQTDDSQFSKLKAGDRIEIGHLRSVFTEEFLSSRQNDYILLAIVNPHCQFVIRSVDISDRLKTLISRSKLNILFLPGVFSPLVSREPDLDEFASVLGFEDLAVWDSLDAIPEYLTTMPTPAYLFVDSEGVVLRLWYTSSSVPSVRMRMADQIFADILVITETKGAILSNGIDR